MTNRNHAARLIDRTRKNIRNQQQEPISGHYEDVELITRAYFAIQAVLELHYCDDRNPLLVDHCFHCKTEYPCDTAQAALNKLGITDS